MRPSSRIAVGALVAAALWAVGCGGGGGDKSTFVGTGVDGGGGLLPDATLFGDATFGDVFAPPVFVNDGGSADAPSIDPDAQGVFAISPSGRQTITVTAGQTSPTVPLTATLSGLPVNAGWNVDRGDLGTVTTGPSSTSVFTPTGTTGGLVTVTAGFNGKTTTVQVFVKLVAHQNGADPSAPGAQAQIATSQAQLTQGGGIGGVGGEGLGGPVTDPGTLAALGTPVNSGSALGLTFIYPYDKTVWPRGMLAPLLMWSWSYGNADAIQISLATTSGSFSWTGIFDRPTVLTTGQSFIRHPIPQDIWDMATNTAGGPTPSGTLDNLTVSLTVAKAVTLDGAVTETGFGPITETWPVAPGRLPGVIYYNSYGTQLVKNSTDQQYQNGGQYGAAVLSITQGATAPTVVAGTASGTSGTGCRVCHVVSSDGSTLIAQHGDSYSVTSAYNLKAANAETVLPPNLFGWAGLSTNGSLAFTNAADLAASAPASQLYAFPPTGTPAPLTATGIPTNLQAGTPAFSPDGKHVAFGFLGGTIGTTTGNSGSTQLVGMNFDSSQNAFSNLVVLATMPSGMRAGFPSFFPTNDAVAFHYQVVNSNHEYNTWHGAEAQIWWSDLATGTAASFYALNGFNAGGTTSYLPTGPTNHANDTVLNYEPTVNPEASGGYIWVIFTSRRLYGSVATTDPWQSDPRNYDATQLANVTCKKLWVAAVDLSATPGSDPSHPAFYLPAQELLAGNSRGFWVLAPCRADGQSCQSGDQCCNGYCEPDGEGGALICANTPPNGACSALNNKCTSAADCCDTTDLCVNGFCTASSMTVPQ